MNSRIVTSQIMKLKYLLIIRLQWQFDLLCDILVCY